MGWLEKFVSESNRIEGINRTPYQKEIEAHETILGLEDVSISDLEQFVWAIAPGHCLRDKVGLDVMIGNHLPPLGGPEVLIQLTAILSQAGTSSPYVIHSLYETLHPFTDGNGRSGRALWLWGMTVSNKLHYAIRLGFLHTWYYQSLEAIH